MKKLNKIVRNENGSITMFVILSVLFLIFVLVGIYANYANKLKAQENRIEKIQGNYGEYASEEEMDKLYLAQTKPEEEEDVTVLPIGDGTTPWLPTGFTKVKGTSLETGLTIANTNDGTAGTQNYVWVEVPNNVKQTITVNSTEKTISLEETTTNEEIALILKAYAKDYRKGSSSQSYDWDDEWYDGNGKTASTSTNLEDTAGCGMTYAEYQEEYSNMLNSIKKYGGFWLAQYEAGISYDKGNRTSHSTINIKKANYAKDQYVYNYVYCNQAQEIANADSISGQYTSSLPFGIQWDLVCKFLEVKEAKTYGEIAANSIWGNYNNTLWTPGNNAKYSTNNGSSYSSVVNSGATYSKTSPTSILLTTGAIDKVTVNSVEYKANPMNIYDLAGNLWEFTLEHSTTGVDIPCSNRGGSCISQSSAYPASVRYVDKSTNFVYGRHGFRSVLYTVESEIAEGTTPWIPEGFSQVAGTSLATGLTIANTDDRTAGTQNYVWIEVPNNVKQTITVNSTETEMSLVEATSNNEIELILKAYAGDYTKGSSTTKTNEWKDEWYSGCGMTYAEYQKAYGSMLKSIQKYGGFWLAQYEAGMSYDKGNRTSNSEITVTKANYAKDQYAYNWVTCSQAQGIANADSVEGKYTSSLPFGIQWDLVCRYLEAKGAKTYDEIATNSTWGNYDNILWTSSANSKYSADGVTFNASAYTKTAVDNILLTTGAISTINSYVNDSGEATTLSTTENPMNIYDLAGNASEWTLENSALSDTPSVRRGGNFYNSYKEFQFAHKLAKETTDVEVYTGFRSTLYTEEDIVIDTETLPSEYQQLEYIESTGTQYIDTKYIANENTSMETKAQLEETDYTRDGALYGARNAYGTNDYVCWYNNYFSASSVNINMVIFGQEQKTESDFDSDFIAHKITYSNSNFYVDDTLIGTYTKEIGNSGLPLYLLTLNTNGTADTRGFFGKLYYCKIWDGETLVRDFVPCYRKSDNVAGMYDLVKGEFYTNKGTGSFLKGPHADGTAEVEYIQSTGTQYINTGMKLNQDSKIELEFEVTEAGDYNIFGSRSSATKNNIGIIFSNTYNEIDVDFQDYTKNRLKTSYDISKRIYSISNEALRAGDTSQSVTNYSNFTTPDNAYIFSMSGTPPTYENAKMKLYYCKIWDGETLVRDYIPLLDKDGLACLYDKVEGKYYYNQGTGTFLYR